MYKVSVLFLLFVCSSVSGQSSEADFVLLQKDYVLNPDGSSDTHYRQIVKYNTHVSFNRLYGETFIVYNPRQQQLKINESYTVQANGNKIVTPQNAFNEVLPRFAADAPDYNHLREMVVTHTGLELGATAYLDYTLHDGAGYAPELDRRLTLQEESPVKEYKVTVTVPDSKKLAYQLHGAKADTKVVKKDGATRYEWTFRNIAASSREYYQPEDGRNAPHLVFSTWPSQQAALQWLAGQMNPGDTGEIQAVFGKIPVREKDEADPNFRLANAYRYLTDHIAYTPIPAEYAGYRLRDAAQVAKQAYGTVGEKAALLLAVAKDLGIEAYCVAVYPSYIDGSAGSLHAIADIAVAVNGEEDFLLSPVTYTKTCLSVSRPNWRYVPMKDDIAEIIAKKCNHAVSYMEIVADPQQVKTSGYAYMTGVECYPDAVPDEKPEKHTGGSLAVKEYDEYSSFTLPEVPGGANSWALPYLGAQRQTTLEIPYPLQESYNYTLWTSADREFINKDMTVEKKNVLGSVNIRIEKRALNYYRVTRSLNLRKSIITSAEYGAFMDLMSAWRNPNYRTVMLKRGSPVGSP
ncbi:MAG: DUF3857 domain-containing protein [Bacteroidales bacterium]|jgi:hypothetical protein|nr:DUF3857 domain-containing protein [Bacteroidales bacterium]